MGEGGGLKKALVSILSILMCIISVIIIILVAAKLYSVEVWYWSTAGGNYGLVYGNVNCLFSDNFDDSRVCEYSYAVAGVSILTCFVLSLFLCITCDACGLGIILELLVGYFHVAWWVVASIVFTDQGNDANGANAPYESYRTGVIVLSWINFSIAVIQSIMYTVQMGKCLFACCAGRKAEAAAHAGKDAAEAHAKEAHGAGDAPAAKPMTSV